MIVPLRIMLESAFFMCYNDKLEGCYTVKPFIYYAFLTLYIPQQIKPEGFV